MIETIKAVQERLAEVTELKYIDEDWGQLDYYSPNFPVQWPCALIDITAAQYTDLGVDRRATVRNRQRGEAVVSITVANMKLSNTSSRAPQSQKENARSIWTTIEAIHAIVHGWSPGGSTGNLTRQGVRRIKRDDGVQEYELLYRVAVHDV